LRNLCLFIMRRRRLRVLTIQMAVEAPASTMSANCWVTQPVKDGGVEGGAILVLLLAAIAFRMVMWMDE